MNLHDPVRLDGFYLPAEFSPPSNIEFYEEKIAEDIRLRQIRVTPELAGAVAAHLRATRGRLRRIPRDVFVDVLDRAAAQWLDRTADDYEPVTAAMGAATGLSREMVEESVRVEQESSGAADMWAALANEFGDPAVLDRFTVRPGMRALVRAHGPALTFAFLPGNIPGLSHLPFMRAFLVKSPILCKPASTEPVYAAAYARTLARLSPELASSIAVLYWPGGDQSAEAAVFAHADAVIAFGTAETCADIARRVRPGTRTVLHGHRLGFAYIELPGEPGRIRDVVERLAYDVATFDQQACLSPHWIFVQGGTDETVNGFADGLADALRRIEARFPKGQPPVEEAARFGQVWDDAELAAALGEPVGIHARRGEDRFLVCVDRRRPLTPSCLGRMIRVIPVADLATMERLLEPYRGLFQNAAIEVNAAAQTELAERLATLGVSRICRPGRMATPTMMWHHDGLPCLETLVRYTDLES